MTPQAIRRWELEELEDENSRLRAQLLQRDEFLLRARDELAECISVLQLLLQRDDDGTDEDAAAR